MGGQEELGDGRNTCVYLTVITLVPKEVEL